jgi:hypothetical protein
MNFVLLHCMLHVLPILCFFLRDRSPPTVLHMGRSYRYPSATTFYRLFLQAGRSRVQFPIGSLGFFIDLILPAALGPWDRLRVSTRELPWGVKVAGAQG